MKGILIAGGTGSRLHPMTLGVNKHLLPVYDKPMVYYPLTTLMFAGVRDILIITTKRDQDAFRAALGDGAHWGMSFSYAVQPEPRGIAEALLIGRNFLDGGPSALILGDNIFYGHGLPEILIAAAGANPGATVFGYWVADPGRYGVLDLDPQGRPRAIVEKPALPPTHYAVTGLYFFASDAPELARELRPSARGELEITDLNSLYLAQGRLRAEIFGRGLAWLDTGTPESLARASAYVEAVEQRQGLKIGAPEEVAWRLGLIGDSQLEALAHALRASAYGAYLSSLLPSK
ncbi:MAG: glucose-1-phosphate thymidylyltransferase RfbA [Alphaproteobacteria bacterium]